MSMKKIVTAMLIAALVLGVHARAEENEDGEDTGIRINNGTVEIMEDGEWEPVGTVGAFKLAVQAYQKDADELEKNKADEEETSEPEETEETEANLAGVLETDEEGLLYLNGEPTGYRLEKLEEAEEKEDAQEAESDQESEEKEKDTSEPDVKQDEEEDFTPAISTDEDGILYLDGVSAGYRLVKVEEADGDKNEAEAEEEKAEDAPLILTTDKDGNLLLEGVKTGYRIEKENAGDEADAEVEEELHTVTITYMDTEGNEVGIQELSLPDGSYEEEAEAPEGYELVSANKFTVDGSDLKKNMIVREHIATYEVTMNFLDEDGKTVEERKETLPAGTYSTDITAHKGKDLTIVAPDGYENVAPSEIEVEGSTEADIIVKKGSTCGENAEWSETDKACVCSSGYEGDAYEKGCKAKE